MQQRNEGTVPSTQQSSQAAGIVANNASLPFSQSSSVVDLTYPVVLDTQQVIFQIQSLDDVTIISIKGYVGIYSLESGSVWKKTVVLTTLLFNYYYYYYHFACFIACLLVRYVPPFFFQTDSTFLSINISIHACDLGVLCSYVRNLVFVALS